jgi:hypothetical protein
MAAYKSLEMWRLPSTGEGKGSLNGSYSLSYYPILPFAHRSVDEKMGKYVIIGTLPVPI